MKAYDPQEYKNLKCKLPYNLTSVWKVTTKTVIAKINWYIFIFSISFGKQTYIQGLFDFRAPAFYYEVEL